SIQEIRFRVDESVQTSTAIIFPSLRLYLSSSQKEFSTNPAENYGPDRRLVFDGQNATFLVSKPTSLDDFSIRFPLAQPFNFKLFAGHLVLDIETANDPKGVLPLDVTTRTSALLLSPSGAIDMGTIASQIVFTSVPEPSTGLIALAGGALLCTS